jgi:hypothetical protein
MVRGAYYGPESSEDVFRPCEYNGQEYLDRESGDEGHCEAEFRLDEVHIHCAVENNERDQEVGFDTYQNQQNL